jgi:hypothetical protein
MPEVASSPPGTPNASWITIVICCVEALRRKASDRPEGELAAAAPDLSALAAGARRAPGHRLGAGPATSTCSVPCWPGAAGALFASPMTSAGRPPYACSSSASGTGGVPAVVLADRMGCLKTGVVANVVVPHPEYVRFFTCQRFQPGSGVCHPSATDPGLGGRFRSPAPWDSRR